MLDRMGRRKTWLAMIALLTIVAVARHPTATIEIRTHDAGDRAPHSFQAAIDLGVVAFNLLLTWTGHTR